MPWFPVNRHPKFAVSGSYYNLQHCWLVNFHVFSTCLRRTFCWDRVRWYTRAYILTASTTAELRNCDFNGDLLYSLRHYLNFAIWPIISSILKFFRFQRFPLLSQWFTYGNTLRHSVERLVFYTKRNAFTLGLLLLPQFLWRRLNTHKWYLTEQHFIITKLY